LLSGFINKYLPEYKERTGMLETPIIGFLKAQKLQRWSYDLDDESKTKPGEVPFYYKGLGSWEKEDLKKVVKTDGLEKMIKMLDFSSEDAYNSLEEWLGDDSEPRKKHILENDFNIADV
jgi:DNA gyrase/topoisomerase IV subunit B